VTQQKRFEPMDQWSIQWRLTRSLNEQDEQRLREEIGIWKQKLETYARDLVQETEAVMLVTWDGP
jgi:hypothetical protein